MPISLHKCHGQKLHCNSPSNLKLSCLCQIEPKGHPNNKLKEHQHIFEPHQVQTPIVFSNPQTSSSESPLPAAMAPETTISQAQLDPNYSMIYSPYQ